jgi:hypothetical protein
MSTTLKSMAILLATLCIGIMVGVLGSRLYIEHRVQKFRDIRGEQMFGGIMEEIIQPTPEQADTLKSIFAKYQKSMQKMNGQFRSQTKAILDSMHAEIAPLLTKEQLKRLEERRMNPSFRPPFEGRPMPPFGNGPFRNNRNLRKDAPMFPPSDDAFPEPPPMP